MCPRQFIWGFVNTPVPPTAYIPKTVICQDYSCLGIEIWKAVIVLNISLFMRAAYIQGKAFDE